MPRLLAAAGLSLRFVRAVFLSGLQTVAVILKSGRPGGTPPPVALVRVRFAPMSARGAALLGSLVSLTPGTTTIDIDLERRELLLHVLDASDTDALVAGIRQDFEPGIRALFGREVTT
ncbi:MAG: Na+/H+ antiporter subunit E [Gammaproteobacteria bacterium]|nr:Na+/H+ antiporter subunit E [Gammaproteobacteria bacterium]